ncbi:sigma D regulator [Aurantivibrio plasticivorans]
MLENCKSAKERWGGVSEIIDRWLQERQDMLVQFCDLSEGLDFDLNEDEAGIKLRRLCQIMMDYVSAGHFEVYEQLIKESQELNDTDALKQADVLFTKIDKTTDAILDFNDKYQETDDLESLTGDLSRIGENLANRFEIEDQMIDVLHTSHKDLVA